MTTSDRSRNLLSTLLTRTQTMSAADFAEAVEVSSLMGAALAETLLNAGYISGHVLDSAMELRELLGDGLLDEDTAVSVLQEVKASGLPARQILAQRGWTPPKGSLSQVLAELLLSAEIISRTDFDDVQVIARQREIPFGTALRLSGKITDYTLWAGLNAMVMLRSGVLSIEQARRGLKAAHAKGVPFEFMVDAELAGTQRRRAMRLGELLVLSGLVTDLEMMTALEIALISDKPLGQVLVERQVFTMELLYKALDVQDLVDQGKLKTSQAGDVLKHAAYQGWTIEHAMARLGLWTGGSTNESIRLGELLKQAGVLTDEQIDDAIDLSRKNSTMLGRMLLVTGYIEKRLLDAATECQFLVRSGKLSPEQGTQALNLCYQSQVSFTEALQTLKIKTDNGL